ncbi:efflux RND transporter periplasmic adaptor subunit [Halobacteriovorax marinus]|uniref:efflux RND transporter periplasmic adaptor subunit n=1 Tax=Halobacteriovorax marinus TaxID=97084 RepID=UPI001F1933AC|nr:efflux RND transporter periplasmic adaptor subunit [Halobacteriovorax marinus]
MNKYLIITLLFLSFGCDKSEHSNHVHDSDSKSGSVKTYYTCSMHPSVKEDAPGKCPICHMNLTKVEVDDSSESKDQVSNTPKVIYRCKDYPEVTSEVKEECPIDGTMMISDSLSEASKIVAKVKLRSSQLSHFKPDYFPVTSMRMTKRIRLLGSVLQSEEKESNIPARIGGRVEKVYVKSSGSFIRVGDPVVEIYSPKLITAGEEYLVARESFSKTKKREFKEMLEQSKEKLRLLGIRSKQIEKWYKDKTVPKNIIIYSNTTGVVRKKNAFVGAYFKEGQNFFELSDLSDVWVEMDVYEQDSSLVQLGQRVELEFSALPGVKINGVIDFINPVLDSQSRTLKVRATIKNESGKLRPGMIANAVLEIKFDGLPLVVPRSAIIDTGKRKVVWLKVSDKDFRALSIQTGFESDGYVEVVTGLKEGDQVVIEGNFLLDAQAQLFGGYEDMESSPAMEGHNH